MFFKKASITVISSVLLLMPTTSVVSAATFTNGEINQIHNLQNEYSALDKTKYSVKNIYQTKPHLKKKFSAGSLKESYISSQIAYINYYRSLFGLQPVTGDSIANDSAQKTAAVMAAINANPFINQHGLPSDIRPSYINKSLWKLAQTTSQTSNLNFNVANQSAGDVITDLLTDHYNLTGSDTGHRAWLLSTRLSTTGIGAAYGSNGYRYSVQKVLNVNDIFRAASQPLVAYPNAGVFPIELVKGKNISWSIYFSNKTYSGTPSIQITDNDTGKTYNATNVTNYSKAGYGNFKTVITYSPGNMPIVDGHSYTVDIEGLYKYTFKLFKQNTSEQTYSTTSDSDSASSYQKAAVQQDTHSEVSLPNVSAKIWAAFNPKIKDFRDNSYLEAFKKGQWKHNFFLKRVPQTIK